MKQEHWDSIALTKGFESITALLHDWYIVQQWSKEAIALELCVDRSTVTRLLEKAGIETRIIVALEISKHEATNLTIGQLARKYHVSLATAWRAKNRAKKES